MGMSTSSMAIGARLAPPVAGAARANARGRSSSASLARIITSSSKRRARRAFPVVAAAADSPTGASDKESVDKTTNADGSVVYSFGDDVIAEVDTKTSFDLPPLAKNSERDDGDDEDDRATTGEAPASNAVWKRRDEPAPPAPSRDATQNAPPVNTAGPSAPKFNLTPKKTPGEEKEDETPPADAASPEYDLEDAENARKVAKGAAILTAGTASVVALTLGVGGAAVVESLDKIPLLSGFEEALGVAVSAYYANKFKGSFLTAAGRESLRLGLVEKFTQATGLASLAGKLARTDPELDAQIKGVIGDLSQLPRGGEELPVAVREAIAAFIRNRDGALAEETAALRASNDALQREVDKIELLQTELEQARRETTYARANIRVMNLGEKERTALRDAADEAKRAGDARVAALREQMEKMAADAAAAAAEAEKRWRAARADASRLASGEQIPPPPPPKRNAAARWPRRSRRLSAPPPSASPRSSHPAARAAEAEKRLKKSGGGGRGQFAEELAAKVAEALEAAEARSIDVSAANERARRGREGSSTSSEHRTPRWSGASRRNPPPPPERRGSNRKPPPPPR